MSGYTQNENVSRGSDTIIDRYCNSLNILKEKVMNLLEQYHSIIMQKMECDLGNFRYLQKFTAIGQIAFLVVMVS